MNIMKKETSADMSSTETIIRFMDYRSQAEERRRELASLRKKCLANTQASLLSNAEAPKEMAIFLQRQRELFEQERKRRQEAMDLIHGFNEKDGIPPKMEREEEDEFERSRREDAFAFMSRYRAAKEAILRSTEGFWQDAKKEEEEDSSASPSSSLECAKRWDSSNRELDDLITEMEITLSSSSDDSDEIQAPFLKGGKGTWTVIWLSLMTMCSTNVVGLVLSLALLNYNLRPGTAGFEDLINILGDGNFFSMCRELLEAVQESSVDDLLPNFSADEDNESSVVPASKPRYKGVQEEIYERLRDNLDQWMFDSATTFRQALTSIRNGGNGRSILHVPALVSPIQESLGLAESNDVDEEREITEDGDDVTVSDTESTSTESPDFDSKDMIDVPALLLKAQNSIHQFLLDTEANTSADEEENMIDIDFDLPEVDDYASNMSASVDFTRVETFKLLTSAKEDESIDPALDTDDDDDDDDAIDTPSSFPRSHTTAPFDIMQPAPVANNRNARPTVLSTPPSVHTEKPQESKGPNEDKPQEPKSSKDDNSEDSEEKENHTGFPFENDEPIMHVASSDSSSTVHATVPSEEDEEETEFLGDIYDLPEHEYIECPKRDGGSSGHTKHKGAESKAASPLVVPQPTTTPETEDDKSAEIGTKVAASEPMDVMGTTSKSEDVHGDNFERCIAVPNESEREDPTLGFDISPKPTDLPAEKSSRKWGDAFFTLGAMTVIGFGASIVLGARSKR